MQAKAFSHLLKQLKSLTPFQKERVGSSLHQSNAMEKTVDAIDTSQDCPYCSSTKHQKWRVRSGVERYRCNTCEKTYNALTGTPLARLRHKEVWTDFAQDIIESKSIRESARHCGVNKDTAFRWRHRMLSNPKSLTARHLHGIVEFDDGVPLEGRRTFWSHPKEVATLIGHPGEEVVVQRSEVSLQNRQPNWSPETGTVTRWMPYFSKVISIHLLK